MRVAAAKLEARTKHLLGVLEVLKKLSMICCMYTDCMCVKVPFSLTTDKARSRE